MMEFIHNFHFLRPWFLLLLIIPLLLYFKIKSRTDTTDSAWAKVCDKNLLDFLLIKKQGQTKKTERIIRLLVLILLPLSLAGPCWQKIENPALSVNNPIIIALNMSGGMWSKDVNPSRVVRAKYLIKDILKETDATETGLEVYSREPFMISPITEDKSLIDNLLPAITYDIMPENGDRLDRAIDLAVERLQSTHYKDGNIIVLTYDIGERFDLALESASKAASEGYTVNVIDINTQRNSKLEMVAEKGRGIYAEYNEDLSTLFNKINNIGKNKFKQSENMQTIWLDNGYYLLFLPAFLLLYFFRRGAVLMLLLTVLYAQNAAAGWFLNNNQEAMRAFENNDFGTASQKFEVQDWKAGAAYKNGEYEKAAKIYSSFNDTENLYNYANSLAKSGKIKEAIEKYEEVLKQNPAHEDARFNLEYLKKQQEQNQQQQQNKQNQKQDQQNKNEQKQNNNQNQQNNQQQQQDMQSEQSETDQNQQQQGEQNAEENNKNKNEQSVNSEQETPSGKKEAEDKNNEQQQSQVQNQQQEGDEERQMQTLSDGEQQKDDEEQQMRARKQKFRNIKEDKGGLLRAFIKKEYDRKRYKE